MSKDDNSISISFFIDGVLQTLNGKIIRFEDSINPLGQRYVCIKLDKDNVIQVCASRIKLEDKDE